MAHTVEEGKLVKAIPFENALEIEFQVRGPRRARRIAQQVQQQAIRDNAPQVRFAVVQILLHQSLGAKTASLRSIIELDPKALDTDGWRFFTYSRPVRDGIV